MEKNPLSSAGEERDTGLSLGQEDPLQWETASHSSLPAWKIPCKRNLEGFSPWGLRGSDTAEQPSIAALLTLEC